MSESKAKNVAKYVIPTILSNVCFFLFTVVDGANKVFRHGMIVLGAASIILSAIGVFFTGPVCRLLGAGDTFYEMSWDYLYWYSLFIIPSGLSMGLQHYCRNDGAPGLVAALRS